MKLAMNQRILVIQGHPDADSTHFCHALAQAYIEAAQQAGHEVRVITVAALDFPLIRSAREYAGEPPDNIRQCQDDIRWANHLVFVYPLWMGSMPALLKGFMEQVFRENFGLQVGQDGKAWQRMLKGKSARIVITMGMPALVYRWFFGAHSLKSLERNILKFCGIKPIRESLVGLVEGSPRHRRRWLDKMARLGKAGR